MTTLHILTSELEEQIDRLGEAIELAINTTYFADRDSEMAERNGVDLLGNLVSIRTELKALMTAGAQSRAERFAVEAGARDLAVMERAAAGRRASTEPTSALTVD